MNPVRRWGLKVRANGLIPLEPGLVHYEDKFSFYSFYLSPSYHFMEGQITLQEDFVRIELNHALPKLLE